MDALSSPIPRSRGRIAYLSRPWPSEIRGLGNLRSGAWVCGVTEGGLHALWQCAAPKPKLSCPSRAHRLGHIMRVPGCGRGCAGGMFGGDIHPQMGGQDGCSAPNSACSAATAMSPGFGDMINFIGAYLWAPYFTAAVTVGSSAPCPGNRATRS